MRPGGQLLFDGDEPLLRAGAAHVRQDITLRPVSLTDKAADFFVSGIRAAADGTVFDLRLPDGSVWHDLRIPRRGGISCWTPPMRRAWVPVRRQPGGGGAGAG